MGHCYLESKVSNLDPRNAKDKRQQLHLRDMSLQGNACDLLEREDEGLGATPKAAHAMRVVK